MMKTRLVHGLSVDIEDYYSGSCRNYYPPDFACLDEVETNTLNLLMLMSKYDISATFFIVGELAQKIPGLLRTIQSEGHEIGVHGWRHISIAFLNKATFKEETYTAKDTVEQIVGDAISGYRAPYRSLFPQNIAAIDVLKELGFKYDSSMSDTVLMRFLREKTAFEWENGLVELPVTSAHVGPFHIPCIGGGYLRHFPLWWTRLALQHVQRSNRTAILYIHPYEIEKSFPVFPQGKTLSPRLFAFHLQQFHNRGKKHYRKLDILCREFRFTSLLNIMKSTQNDRIRLPIEKIG